MKLHTIILALISAVSLAGGAFAQNTLTLPPALTAAGTTATLDGQSWGYVVWNASSAEWLANHQVAVYLKAGPGGSFERQGIMAPLTDPNAIKPWIIRAAKLGDDVGECADIAKALHKQWMTAGEPLPDPLHERLSMLGVRGSQDPGSASALRQIGNAHPLFRFLSGTGWGGPLGVANGQSVTIELRERSGGVEGAVVGRVTLTAGTTDSLVAAGAPVQVEPDFPTSLPPGPLAPPTSQLDRAIHLRWAIPDALRRQVLLTRGFYVWRLEQGHTPPGGLNGKALLAAESTDQVKRLTRHPAITSKLFDSGTTNGAVADFDSDRTTWFVVDDGERYEFTGEFPGPITIVGAPYAENQRYDYVVAPVDLLGRVGPISPRGTGTAAYTVPPPVPDVLRVENVMDAGVQRLKISWKRNPNEASDIPTTHYLIFRDRDLDKSSFSTQQSTLTYLTAIPSNAVTGDILSHIDRALDPIPGELSKTYFYSIRAAHLGPFGYVLSAPSPPEFGTLRDREGPPAPTGYVTTDCSRAGAKFEFLPNALDRATLIGPEDIDPDHSVLRLNARRGLTDGRWKDVAWANFIIVHPSSGFTHITPLLFFGRGDLVWTDVVVPKGASIEDPFIVSVIAGTTSGRASHPYPAAVRGIESGNLYELNTRVVGTRALEMRPPGKNEFEYWTPYFATAVQGLTPTATVPGTLRATLGDDPTETDRTYVIQVQLGPAYYNYETTLRPANSSTLAFSEFGGDLGFPIRAWEITDPPGLPFCRHRAKIPGSPQLNQINVAMTMPVGAKEYRIYRRVDDGPLALLSQDVEKWDDNSVQQIVHNDTIPPTAGDTISYFGQVFDEHGNPSPLVLLGQNIINLPALPTPVLDPVKMTGNSLSPTVVLRAACPRPGVKRIEFTVKGNLPPNPGLTTTDKSIPLQNPADPDGPPLLVGSLLFNFEPGVAIAEPQDYTITQMTQLEFNPDPNSPFIAEKTINVIAGEEYTVSVNTVDAEGNPGPPSAWLTFTWTPPVVPGTVAWPAKAAPPLIEWHEDITAFETSLLNFVTVQGIITSHYAEQYPVAIRLGRVPANLLLEDWDVTLLGANNYFATKVAEGFDDDPPRADLMKQFLLPDATRFGDIVVSNSDRSLLPVVLYRKQTHRRIGGQDIATPDTDTIQASPMIEHIAWYKNDPNNPTLALFVDPFVAIANTGDLEDPSFDLCLFDNSPVASGATYHYYLAHFDPLGEPDAIIDVGTVTIEP